MEKNKKMPYVAPDIATVLFQVERGLQVSDPVEMPNGLTGQEYLQQMIFAAQQPQQEGYMGTQMGYFSSDGYFGSSGTTDGGYFGGGF